jgi:predicted CDP-diglyceride synthetase/phosphatidate cytidylyltransferase
MLQSRVNEWWLFVLVIVVANKIARCTFIFVGFAEKVFSSSDTRRRSEGIYEYCELKPTK